MVPTSLPELPKPSKTLGKSQQPQFLNPKLLRQDEEKHLISLLIPFWGAY